MSKVVNEWKLGSHAETPVEPEFLGAPGIRIDMPINSQPIDFFNLILNSDFMELVIEQTNLYATQYIARETISKSSRINAWKNITAVDIRNFLGLSILMGIDQKPSIESYWSNDTLLFNSTFGAVMSRNKYQMILKFLHFADNSLYNCNDPNRDRLYKVRPFLDHFLLKFQELYNPTKECSIDEQLLLYKGLLQFKQYIPMKRARFGIKIFSLCDSTGYLYTSEVYVGKMVEDEHKNLGKTGAIVVKLMQGLLDQGHHLYLDNWYSSPALYKYLFERKTMACGTVRKFRLKAKKLFNEKIQKGETMSGTNGCEISG